MVENSGATRALSFSYQVGIGDPRKGIGVPTGAAAMHRIEAKSDEDGWEFHVPTAAQMKQTGNSASIHLMPAAAHLICLNPKKRDPASEETEFFVESQQLYIPSPGVVDGIHRFEIRPSQGLVKNLKFQIPDGFTVSKVEGGPVAAWHFDPEKKFMTAEIEPAQSATFSLAVETQSGLSAFPTEASLAPLIVDSAEGQTGMIGLAFRGDAKPETITAASLSPVNLDDFDGELIKKSSATLHRAYRFKENGGSLVAKLTEVSPEVRVASKQVISFGDENLALNINFAADITRAGILPAYLFHSRKFRDQFNFRGRTAKLDRHGRRWRSRHHAAFQRKNPGAPRVFRFPQLGHPTPR